MPEEEINTYSTKVEPQQTLEIPKSDESWDDVLDENGVIPTTLNVPVMVQRLAKDIYKNATSGIRELYMNAVRGCTDGVEMFGYSNPHITVTLNEAERIITIEDNGRGITKARFKQVLRELGTSDNHDGKTTGQFGMGFASYMTLASVCVLDTIGDNGDNYKMLCRDGTSSKPAGKADLESHGVKLTLTCYENVDFTAVVDKLYDTARHASVPTTVIIETFDYNPSELHEGINEIEQVRFDDDIINNVEQEGVLHINHSDFTLLASDSVEYGEGHVYLLNVPIDSEIEIPFSYWVLNIKDERKFQPMPDRDRMREESDKALQTLITNSLKAHFSTMRIENYKEYITSDRRQEFIWLLGNNEYAPEAMRPLLARLNGAGSLKEVVYRKDQPSGHGLTYWLRASGEAGITYQGYKNKAYTDKVREFIQPTTQLLIARKGKNENWRESVQVLEEFGVPMVKQILKDNKVKIVRPKGEDVDERTIVGHEHLRSYETQEYIFEDIDETFIRTNSIKMGEMIGFVRSYPTNMTFLRNDPALKETSCRTLMGWLDAFKNEEVKTNKGMMVADTIAQTEQLHYCPDLEDGLDSLFEGLDELYVLDNTKILGIALLRHFGEYAKGHSLFDVEYSSTLFTQKLGVHIYDDKTKQYVLEHLPEIKSSYHELFTRVIAKCDKDFADEVALAQMDKYLEIIKGYGELESDDTIEKLKFFHAKWMNLPNKEASITRIFDELVDKCISEITDNSFLMSRFLQHQALPKLFGGVVIKKVLYKDEYHQRNTTGFKVEFTSDLRTLNFKEEIKVLGIKIEFTNLHVRIFNKHSLITSDLEITS